MWISLWWSIGRFSSFWCTWWNCSMCWCWISQWDDLSHTKSEGVIMSVSSISKVSKCQVRNRKVETQVERKMQSTTSFTKRMKGCFNSISYSFVWKFLLSICIVNVIGDHRVHEDIDTDTEFHRNRSLRLSYRPTILSYRGCVVALFIWSISNRKHLSLLQG